MSQPNITGPAIPPGLSEVLWELRGVRGFDPEYATGRKLALINQFFGEHGLDAVVVGVSGGVDSALVLALLVGASRVPGSPLRRVVALQAPIAGRGATGQDQATERGRLVAEAVGAEAWHSDLSRVQVEYVTQLGKYANSNAWAEGQLLSILRTPALYYAAALLQAEGFRSLVAGTTNRDEGAYLGFFGKASDAMVDLQPISDLHKSEVAQLAQRLGVPDCVVNRAPRGDVFDGRTDEEMIGAPYWAVELYLLARCLDSYEVTARLDAGERDLWQGYVQRIRQKHSENAHKYKVGNPSVHLDVYARAVPGGWR